MSRFSLLRLKLTVPLSLLFSSLMFPVLAFLEFLHSQCSVPMITGETVCQLFFLGCKTVCIQKADSKYAILCLFCFSHFLFVCNLEVNSNFTTISIY